MAKSYPTPVFLVDEVAGIDTTNIRSTITLMSDGAPIRVSLCGHDLQVLARMAAKAALQVWEHIEASNNVVSLPKKRRA